jgi:hypothetical protein
MTLPFSVSELLKQAKSLIGAPDRWCQGVASIRAEGSYCLPTDPAAIVWCAAGAIWHVGRDNPAGRDESLRLLCAAAWQVFGEDHLAVNDRLGYSAVMTMFDTAIALAGAKPPPAPAPGDTSEPRKSPS